MKEAALAAVAFFSFIAVVIPTQAGAFWPFTPARADAPSSGSIFLAYANPPSLLRAPTAPDPSPSATDSVPLAMTDGTALISPTSPEGSSAYTPLPSNGGQISLYVVRPGDTLSTIAQMFGVSVNTILWANNIRNPSLIKPGDTLTILPVSGLQHIVSKGETLASIAKKYHADAGDIALYNQLAPNATLFPGEKIIIPGGELPTSPRRYRSRGGARHPSPYAPNPYRGGSGPALPGFFTDPLPGGIITQTLHGWNAFDIGARTGTPIHAAAAGTVIVSRVGGWNGGYGNYVVINHGNGTQTLYAHMSRDVSRVGEHVARGQIIGYVGRTGEATGPHLHFEVRGAKNPFAACRLREVDTRCFMR